MLLVPLPSRLLFLVQPQIQIKPPCLIMLPALLPTQPFPWHALLGAPQANSKDHQQQTEEHEPMEEEDEEEGVDLDEDQGSEGPEDCVYEGSWAEQDLCFSLKLSPEDFPQHLAVHVTVSMRQEGSLTAIGSLHGSLVDLHALCHARGGLFRLADCHSRELQGVCTEFFDDDGTPRLANAPVLRAQLEAPPAHSAAPASCRADAEDWSPRALLHIAKVQVAVKHRGKDVGLRLVHATMRWLLRPGAAATPSGPWRSWGLCTMEPGFLRYDPHFPSDEAVGDAMVRLVRHWARLGFRQAAVGSDYWFVLPERLTFASKAEVDASGTFSFIRAPKPAPTAEADEPLLRALESLAYGATGPSAWAALDAAVAAGASVNRCHAMQRAVGLRLKPEVAVPLLRRLVTLGGLANDADEAGVTALHVAAASCGEGLAAARELLALGADRGAFAYNGTTPLHHCLSSIQSSADMSIAFGMRPPDGAAYEMVVELLRGTPEGDLLIDGALTPKMHWALRNQADNYAWVTAGEVEGLHGRTRRLTARQTDRLLASGCLPAEMQAKGVLPSYLSGLVACFEAVSEVLQQQRLLPTPARVLACMGPDGARWVAEGGNIEAALRGLVDAAKGESFKYGSGEREEMWGEEYDVLPSVPALDDVYEWLCFKLLGPGWDRRQ